MFFFIFVCFCAFKCRNINVQNYIYDAFLKGKLHLAMCSICTYSISWTERVFCSSILDFISFVWTVLLT